jgi:hypothetical protein
MHFLPRRWHGRLTIGLGDYALINTIYHIQVRTLNINGASTLFLKGVKWWYIPIEGKVANIIVAPTTIVATTIAKKMTQKNCPNFHHSHDA